MNMKQYFKHILAFCFCVVMFLTLNAAPSRFTAKVQLDSVYILMGKQTPLHVEIVGPLTETGGILTADSLWTDVEVASLGNPVITDLGNGRKQLNQDIIIQAFDSGMYTLPPVIYLQEGETVFSNTPVLKVLPVPVDSMVTVHDYADVADVNRHFLDYFPDWFSDYGIWILLALILLAVCVFVYMKWLRKGNLPLISKKKPEPPYEVAVKSLEALHDEHLCERGQVKEYYTRLTDILRVYLHRRFGINAMEMTSTEIRAAVRKNQETRPSEAYMAKILEISDFVKFAKVRPMPEDNERAFRDAMQFVEDTKPVEIAPEEETSEENTGKPAANTTKKKEEKK